MKVLQITRIHHPGRNATNVKDFYYRGYDIQDNGLRDVAAGMIEAGEIARRTLHLSDDGDRLTVITLFNSEHAYDKWENHPTLATARKMWEGREWSGGNETVFCKEFIEVGT